jgi:hypothetical protein
MAKFVAYVNLMTGLGPEEGVTSEIEAAAVASDTFAHQLGDGLIEVVPIGQQPEIVVIKHDEIIILVDELYVISREKALALFEAGARGEPANVVDFGGRAIGEPFCTFIYDDDWNKEHLAEVIANLKQSINHPKETPNDKTHPTSKPPISIVTLQVACLAEDAEDVKGSLFNSEDENCWYLGNNYPLGPIHVGIRQPTDDEEARALASLENEDDDEDEFAYWQPAEDEMPEGLPSFGVFRDVEKGKRAYPQVTKWVGYHDGDIEAPTFMD